MRFSRLVLVGLFSMFATFAFASNQEPRFLGPPIKLVEMPDYSKWNKTADHSMSYLFKGNKVQVRDEHYEYANPEKKEGFSVIIFYNPDTGQAWFALYLHGYFPDQQKPTEAYLYEAGENGAWIFVQDVSKSEGEFLKSRYDLVQIQK